MLSKPALWTFKNDAIRHAVELDAFNSAERRLNESKGYLREVKPQEKAETGDTNISLLKTVQDIQKEMKDLKMKVEKGNDNKSYSTVVSCHICKKRGHVKKNCFKYQRMMNGSVQNNPNQRSTGERNEHRNDGKNYKQHGKSDRNKQKGWKSWNICSLKQS